MKNFKPKLIGIYILLIVVVFGYNTFGIGQPKNIESVVQRELKSNQVSSFNHLLKYTLPKGYSIDNSTEGITEIMIFNDDSFSQVMAEIIDKDFLPIDSFYETQSMLLSSLGDYVNLVEDRIEDKEKIITTKFYDFSNQMLPLYFYLNVIEFKENPNQYIGIVGTSFNPEFNVEILDFAKSIEFTKQSIDKERTFSNENENIEITIPANWRRFHKNVPYSFFNQINENEILYSYTSTLDKTLENPEEIFNNIKNLFETNFQDYSIYKEETIESPNNKIITTIVYEYNLNGSKAYTSYSLVDFNNSDIVALCSFDIISDRDFSEFVPELMTILDSIKIK